jgi:hypothetical protein
MGNHEKTLNPQKWVNGRKMGEGGREEENE